MLLLNQLFACSLLILPKRMHCRYYHEFRSITSLPLRCVVALQGVSLQALLQPVGMCDAGHPLKRPSSSQGAELAAAKDRPKKAARSESRCQHGSNNAKTSATDLECKLTQMLSTLRPDQVLTLRNNIESMSPSVRVGTMCSGSDIQDQVGQALFRVLGVGGTYETAFTCEKDARKQSWLMNMMHGGRDICCFNDICDMGAATAACAKHTSYCDVPNDVPLLVCSFSCKDLSKMNNKFTYKSRAAALEEMRVKGNMLCNTAPDSYQAILISVLCADSEANVAQV
jgi:hypothetical protein